LGQARRLQELGQRISVLARASEALVCEGAERRSRTS
jgi:hypothetical protein